MKFSVVVHDITGDDGQPNRLEHEYDGSAKYSLDGAVLTVFNNQNVKIVYGPGHWREIREAEARKSAPRVFA